METNPIHELFSNTRINAVMANAMSSDNMELIELEACIESLLDSVMKGILEVVKDCKTNPDAPYELVIKFDDKDSDLIVGEVVARLESLGYIVQVNCESQEEVDHLDSLSELADEDESIDNMLEDFFYSQRDYVIRWDLNLGEYGDDD